MNNMDKINAKLLADWKILKKLELLDAIFVSIGDAFAEQRIKNLYFGRFYTLKAEIENATTVEELKLLEIN